MVAKGTWIWDWLLNVVDYHRPNLLLSCGDWGEEVSENMFRKLLERVEVLTIFGNHDNLEVLQKLGILMGDGIVYKYEGLRIAGINGIVSMKNKARDNVPRKSPEEFLSVAKKLQERRVDILLMHEVPYLPKIFKRIDKRPGSLVALKALMLIKPKLAIIGHIHEHFKYACYNDILVMSIDTSWKSREYIVIENYGSLKVTVWRNYTILYKDKDIPSHQVALFR